MRERARSSASRAAWKWFSSRAMACLRKLMVGEPDAVLQRRSELIPAGRSQRRAITHRLERPIDPERSARIGAERCKERLDVAPFVGTEGRCGYGVPESLPGRGVL